MAKDNEGCAVSIGGQALIEGILMKSPEKTCVALRSPEGEISKQYIEIPSLAEKYKIFKLPIFRGIGGFIDSMQVGYKALALSADNFDLEDDEDKEESWLEKKLGKQISNILVAVSSVLGVFLSVLLFFVLPSFLFNITMKASPALYSNMLFRSVFEGVVRIIIFLVYLMFCSRVKEIHRVFQYHGAEHKTIFCYEHGDELTIENVKNQSRFHPRCGTSFMIIMILIGVILGIFIPFEGALIRAFTKILCIPLLVGVGYELLKICGKYDNTFTRIIAAPGLWMQRITTKEPEDDMIEVAIESVKMVLPEYNEDLVKSEAQTSL